MPLSGPSAFFFGRKGGYTAEAGHLNLTVVERIPINTTMEFSLTLVNKGVQIDARCQYGTPFCTGSRTAAKYAKRLYLYGTPFCAGSSSAANYGKACPTVGKICSGVCRLGANSLCLGGFCTPPSNGQQCPENALVNGSAAYKSCPENALVNGSAAYKSTLTDTAVEDLRALCMDQSECEPPNTDMTCTNQLDCTGPIDPSKNPFTASYQQVLGPQRCVRLPDNGKIELTVTDKNVHAPWRRLSGQVFGFTSPNSAEFTTRMRTETTTGAAALNMAQR
ncbi:hypothetical protein T484DRAFT_1828991 [Baffinella frigidus]|nr:hypothetical protein T484DRAFT_1828991 [Cryptophyta sp. CCMP2293]